MIIIAKIFIYFISMLILYDVAQLDISIWSKLVVIDFIGRKPDGLALWMNNVSSHTIKRYIQNQKFN